jgi:uncharacterized protein (TIGR02246 family)
MQFLTRSRIVVLLILASALVITPGIRAQDDAAKVLPEMEKALWAAWAKADLATFQQHLAENTVNIGSGGVDIGKAKVLEGMTAGACKVANYTLGEMTVSRVSDSTAVLTYTATQDATCRGQKLPAKVVVSAVWVKQGTQWRSALYHESPVGM